MPRPAQPTARRPRWLLPLLSFALTAGAFVLLDLGLRLLSAVPPDDPLLLYARTYERGFSPFVAAGDGLLAVKPDWVNDGTVHRVTRGVREGQYFSYPGFRPSRITARKAPGSLRVFVIGGSSAFGLYVGESQAFPARLEERLGALAGDARRVEVVNLASVGWASDRVSNVLDAVLALDADLVVVYCGHNELLKGRPDAAADLGRLQRLRVSLLSFSTLVGWINHAIRSRLFAAEDELVREEVAALEAGRLLTYDPDRTPPALHARFLREAAPLYARNLRAMIAKAQARSVPLLFVLPVANLLEPPHHPAHAPSFRERAGFDRELAAGRAAGERGDLAGALAHFERAVALSPEHAGAHFAHGLALLRLGRGAPARESLQGALDRDHWTHRITSSLETTMIEAVRDDAAWVDLRPAFYATMGEAAILPLFLDHVHPSAQGHARIAERIAPEAARLLGLGWRDVPDR